MKVENARAPWGRCVVVIAAATALAAACGSEVAELGPGDPDGGDGSVDGSSGGGGSSGSSGTTSSSGSSSSSSGGGKDGSTDGDAADGCVPPVKNDPKNCGTCGNACAPGQICNDAGKCDCPPYQTLCKGVCIVTSNDPNNCGACGAVCPGTTACSAGVCSAECTTPPPGGNAQIIKCGKLCVDRFNDNKNCGACGNDCTATGKVCVGGVCQTASFPPLDAGATACAGGGPPIVIDDGTSTKCAGGLAQTTFRWGMCACGNAQFNKSSSSPSLYIDGYDSSKGPWDPSKPQLGGSLGVNGTFTSNGSGPPTEQLVYVGGHMWGASTLTCNGNGPVDVRQELHAQGPIATTARFRTGEPLGGGVAWDGYVIGDIAGAAAPNEMTFYKDLYVPQAGSTRTNVVVNGAVKSKVPDFTVDPPCDACGAAQIPVGAIVDTYAAAGKNDNAKIGISSSALANLSGNTRLDLPCGYYYFDSINTTGNLTIYARGHTAVFVGGDVVGSVVSFSVDPIGALDVFVKRTVSTGSDLVVGNPNYAALTRLYVGGAGLGLNGEAHVAGLLYAANSNVNLTSHLTVYGAFYSNDFTSVENTDIHYDRAALSTGKICPPPPPPPPADGGAPDSGADAGGDAAPPKGTPCGTCKDCGNQACVQPAGVCGSCTSSSQCCAPLVCIGGTCKVSP